MTITPFVGDQEYFPGISRIPFEGPNSDNPLAFKAYEADRMVGARSMAEWLRFAVCYWHSFTAGGVDAFGAATREFPWDQAPEEGMAARQRLDAAFEFFSKLGVGYFCFHDRDMAPEGTSVMESERLLFDMVALAKERMQATGVRLLWGTANLFSHPRYMNGAATNPDFNVVSHAAAQVKAAIDATIALDGENYVFWGGREGYASLLNTDTKREIAHLGRFLAMARDYGRAQGFQGVFLIEPKPMEPMKHQYDFDAQTVIGFLREHGLDEDFKVNIEANHATLAGHSFAHELQMCSDAGLLGSIDANRGDPQLGWDTDQFPLDVADCTQAMLIVLAQGGIAPGGLNFDARLRRESTDLEDLFLAHIGGMDAFARGLLIAHQVLQDGRFEAFRAHRYASFDSAEGKAFEEGRLSFDDLGRHATAHPNPSVISGKQELIENLMADLSARANIRS